MTYFRKEVTAIYLRDVSKEVSNHILEKKNDHGQGQIRGLRYSNETVAHEMRAPLGSIIVIISLLLGMRHEAKKMKHIRKYYRQIKS